MAFSPENEALVERILGAGWHHIIDGEDDNLGRLLDAARADGAAAECKRIEDMVNNRSSSGVVGVRVGEAGFTLQSPGNESGPSGRVTEIKS